MLSETGLAGARAKAPGFYDAVFHARAVRTSSAMPTSSSDLLSHLKGPAHPLPQVCFNLVVDIVFLEVLSAGHYVLCAQFKTFAFELRFLCKKKFFPRFFVLLAALISLQ